MSRIDAAGTVTVPETGHGCLVFRGSQLLLTDAGDVANDCLAFVRHAAPLRILPLGEHRGRPCVVAEVARECEAPPGHAFRHLRGLLDMLPRVSLMLAARALELLEFDRSHRFCGECGAPTQARAELAARVCSNRACAREHYPRVSPVVIVAVECGTQILLGRSAHFPPGMYSALAGFVDVGESAEDAVHREVFEETGLRVRNLRYFASQPWPFPHSLMLGYQAEYDGGDIVRAVDELEDVRFFDVDALPAVLPMKYTMASLLLEDFRARHRRR